jgi:glycosyltransferase involved in cell wall biosynthesis
MANPLRPAVAGEGSGAPGAGGVTLARQGPLSEGSPNALLEAMAAGLPIVATEAGGIPEIAADGVNALLVPPRGGEALACAVQMLLGDAMMCHRLGSAARLTVEHRYPPERRAAVLAGVYARVGVPLRSRQRDDGAGLRALTG